MRLLIAIICSVIWVQPAAAEVLRIPGHVIEEAELDRTLISKPGWLRGLHLAGKDLPISQRPQILTVLPRAWRGATICARVTSITGDYFAIIEFAVPATLQASQQAELDFAAKLDAARKITPIDSGVSLEKGPCVGDVEAPDRQFIANFWNQASEPVLNDENEATLVINMNVARADELKARSVIEGQKDRTPDCEKLVDPQALAFNFKCTIGVPQEVFTSLEPQKMTFSYERIYRGRLSKTRKAVIYLGAGQ